MMTFQKTQAFRQHISGILLLSLVLFSACAGNDGFEETKSGLKYKFYSHHPDQPQVQLYDVVKVRMNYRTEDSVLYRGGNRSIPFQIDPVYDGDLMEGLMMMHLDDSATFIQKTADFFLKMMKYEAIPPHAQGVGQLYFDIRVIEIRPETAAIKARRLDMEKRENTEAGKISKYVADQNITQQPTESGLYIIIQKEGNGPVATTGSKVKVHYTGKMLNGKVFDTSADRGKPVSFTLGENEVIPAWDQALAGMKQGTKAELIVPSKLAYGGARRNNIEPFTPLIFDIELIEVK